MFTPGQVKSIWHGVSQHLHFNTPNHLENSSCIYICTHILRVNIGRVRSPDEFYNTGLFLDTVVHSLDKIICLWWTIKALRYPRGIGLWVPQPQPPHIVRPTSVMSVSACVLFRCESYTLFFNMRFVVGGAYLWTYTSARLLCLPSRQANKNETFLAQLTFLLPCF